MTERLWIRCRTTGRIEHLVSSHADDYSVMVEENSLKQNVRRSAMNEENMY